MTKFNAGDRVVVVTNVDGYTENGAVEGEWFIINGVGDYGTVEDYDGNTWPVGVQMDNGQFFYYNESELELAE